VNDAVGRRLGTGAACGAAAYAMWGMFPGFFEVLGFAGPVEILANRIVWTSLVMLLILAVSGRLRTMRRIDVRTWGLAWAAAVALAVNWGVYVWGVTKGHVVECALGYFVNPLVSVLFGVALFRERLSRAQWAALALACVGVLVPALAYHRPPVIALVLAVSFGLYGVIKKLVPLDPLRSVTAEGLTVAPFAVGFLIWSAVTDIGATVHAGPARFGLLMLCGPVTAAPLLLFGVAAQRIPLTVVGVLQYITPSLQLVWALVIEHEAMTVARWQGFALVWLALAIFTVETLRRARRPTSALEEAVQATAGEHRAGSGEHVARVVGGGGDRQGEQLEGVAVGPVALDGGRAAVTATGHGGQQPDSQFGVVGGQCARGQAGDFRLQQRDAVLEGSLGRRVRILHDEQQGGSVPGHDVPP
jgi:chloramphenicol-sensitive protein RarD